MWLGCRSVTIARIEAFVMVESTREFNDKIERETRFYITSLVMLANALGPIVRSHWAVENSLHWVMDMIFRDDECRVRTDHAPANFTTIKHMALNLIRKAPGKDSLRLKRKVAAWTTNFSQSHRRMIFSPIPCPSCPKEDDQDRGRGPQNGRYQCRSDFY